MGRAANCRGRAFFCPPPSAAKKRRAFGPPQERWSGYAHCHPLSQPAAGRQIVAGVLVCFGGAVFRPDAGGAPPSEKGGDEAHPAGLFGGGGVHRPCLGGGLRLPTGLPQLRHRRGLRPRPLAGGAGGCRRRCPRLGQTKLVKKGEDPHVERKKTAFPSPAWRCCCSPARWRCATCPAGGW